GNTLRTVRVQRAAFENGLYIRMGLELLESLVGIEPRIEIIQTDDEANGDTPLGHVVNEAAAELFIAQRPAHRVNDASAGILLLRHIPYFLHADGVHLRIPVFVQIEFPDELLGERAAR